MAEQFYFNGNTALGNALEKCLVEAGFSRTSALADADYVFSYHPLLSQLEDAYFDAKGYLAQAKKGACLIDLSPATPELVREISAISSTSGLFYVEAPLSVADTTLDDAFSQQSNLSCCVAGDKPDIAKAQKILQDFVGTIRVTGEPGSAQLAHAAWTLQHTAQLFAAIEAEALYRAFLRIPTRAAAASAAGASPAGDEEAAIAQAVAQKHFAQIAGLPSGCAVARMGIKEDQVGHGQLPFLSILRMKIPVCRQPGRISTSFYKNLPVLSSRAGRFRSFYHFLEITLPFSDTGRWSAGSCPYPEAWPDGHSCPPDGTWQCPPKRRWRS